MDKLVCSRCWAAYPHAAIVHCSASPSPGGLFLCDPCHKTIHPSCLEKKSTRHLAENLCSWCNCPGACVVCPLCRPDSDGASVARLCASCEKEVHVDHKSIHKDHTFKF